MYSANVYKIFLASPSDVAKERRVARDTINEWNELHSEKAGIILQAIGWETHSYPSTGDRAQSVLNKQILKDADFLIGMFWTRIGTPTGDHESGTLEEIQEHIDAGKPAMICFSNEPVQMASVEQEQYNKLMTFKEECLGKSLVFVYDTTEAFKATINNSLVLRANKEDPFIGYSNTDNKSAAPIVIDAPTEFTKSETLLSAEAKELLIEASIDPDGRIMKLKYLSGSSIEANGCNFLSDTTAREKVKWEAALNFLVNKGLVEELYGKGEIFRVTHFGYKIADQLRDA